MEELFQDALALWDQSPLSEPDLGRVFSPLEQAAREAKLEVFLGSIQAELPRPPRTRGEREEARNRVVAALIRFAKAGLELGDEHLELLFGGGFAAVGTALARRARQFDPSASTADVLQASRNAWTACGLQMLLGRPMILTPSIFAYSMLYPSTDNYMDDPRVTAGLKLDFSDRFRRRLAGGRVTPADDREAGIWRLIGLIEEEYRRAEWPQVFASLLAIHRAQENSIRLHARGSDQGVDIRRLTFEKGGTSVLADGYLAAGTLTPEQARFIYSWGVLLQLADDLEDVGEDRRARALTLFTMAAGGGALDDIINQTLHFSRSVMRRMRALAGPQCQVLAELIERSAKSLLMRGAAAAGELCTRKCLEMLEPHSPFRFAFLARHRERLERRKGLLARLFEAFLAGEEDEPAFPMLPSSLLPRF